MTFPVPYGGITITIERPVYDRFNDATYTEHHKIQNCLEYPSGSEEGSLSAEGGDNSAITTSRALIVPASSDILAVDRVVLHQPGEIDPPIAGSPLRRASTYQVIGEPKDWVHAMTGWRPGMSVVLQKVA